MILFKKLALFTCLVAQVESSSNLRRELNGESVPKGTVAVVGAGLSGLTAAYNLFKRGYKVTVFEAEDRIGGKVESVFLENGAPIIGTAQQPLDADTLARVEEVCGSNNSPTELGAVIATGANLKALADELDVPYADLGLAGNFVVTIPGLGTIKVSRQEYFGLVAQQVLGAGATPEEIQDLIGQAVGAFLVMAAQFPVITTPRHDGSDPELAMPLVQFAAEYGFSVLVEALRPILVGYGYAYFEEVPAGIFLTYLYPIVASLAGINLGQTALIFPCGFQSLLDAMVAELGDVRLDSKVDSVKRIDNFILVKADNQPAQRFESIVISSTLDVVPKFLEQRSEEEDELFSKLQFQRYLSTVTNIVGNDGEMEVEFYADQGIEARINHVNIVAKSTPDTSAELAYQIVDESISKEQAFAVLDADMATYWDGAATGIIAQKDTYNYFPTVSSEDFEDGFYDRMEALQGEKNTYYVGTIYPLKPPRLPKPTPGISLNASLILSHNTVVV